MTYPASHVKVRKMDTIMTDMHWIPIYIQQNQSVMIFWNVYIVVTLGILGFVVQRGASLTRNERLLLVSAFVVFSLSNLIPLYQAQHALVQIYSQLKVKNIFSENSVCPAVITHVIFDIVVIIVLMRWPFKFDKNREDGDT